MHTANKWGAAIALAALLFATQAGALGLGAIDVSSGLGQPFSASIPLHLDSPSDLDGLTVTLAKPAAFRRAGVAPSEAVSTLQFKVVKGQGNTAQIQVKGKQPVHEPFLNFIVDVQWNDGTLLREYTVLLNPPAYGVHPAVSGAKTLAASQVPEQERSAKQKIVPIPELATDAAGTTHRQSSASKQNPPDTAAVQPVPVPEHTQPTLQSEPNPSAKGSRTYQPPPSPPLHSVAAPTPVAYSRIYGPVKAGQTFWSIAENVRPSTAVTLDQALLSIYKANPEAFYQGRFNGLMKGTKLRIPDEAAMQAVSPAAAAAKIRALRAKVNRKNHPKPEPKAKQSKKQIAEHGKETASPSDKSSSEGTQTGLNTQPVPTAPQSVPQPETLNAAAASVAAASVAGSGVPSKAVEAGKPAGAGSTSLAAVGNETRDSRKNINNTSQNTENKDNIEIKNNNELLAGKTYNPPAPAASAGLVAAAAAAPTRGSSVAAPSMSQAGAATGKASAAPSEPGEHKAEPASMANQSSMANAQRGQSANPATQPTTPPKAASATKGNETSSIWMNILSGVNWILVGLLVVLVLLGLMFIGRKRRQADKRESPPDAPSGNDPPSLEGSTNVGPSVVEGSDSAQLPDDEDDGLEAEGANDIIGGPDDPELKVDTDAGYGDETLPAATLAATVGGTQAFATAHEEPVSAEATSEDLLADAEFNLSYGLYDEAATLFRQAATQSPERNDIQLRLAETYFEAGEASKFELLAADLKGRLNAGQWRELAAKGRRLCPGSDLFDPDGDETIAFTASNIEDTAIGLEPPAQESAAPGDNVIKFDMPSLDEETAEDAADDDLDLSGFDDIGSLEDEEDSHIDLGDLDFGLDDEEHAGVREPTQPSAQDSAAAAENLVGKPADSQASPVGGTVPADATPDVTTTDESVSDRIELAQIYASMGDNDAARGVIQDILKDGNAAEKAAADALAKTLAG